MSVTEISVFSYHPFAPWLGFWMWLICGLSRFISIFFVFSLAFHLNYLSGFIYLIRYVPYSNNIKYGILKIHCGVNFYYCGNKILLMCSSLWFLWKRECSTMLMSCSGLSSLMEFPQLQGQWHPKKNSFPRAVLFIGK